ncbi:MAG: CCA tRNA nucleotidyltransferase [Candidatus Obscuribacterales bacterium]|nr:CCA tRNA nucleotidyltransferase [Candidatus Obscuribacterales bacterium]
MDRDKSLHEALPESKAQPDWVSELMPIGTEMANTAGLFMRGKTGIAVTAITFAFGEVYNSCKDKKPEDWNAQAMTIDALKGTVKGGLMKGSLAVLPHLKLNVAGQGVALGIANRFVDSTVGGSPKALATTFDPLAITSDVAVFVAGHGMFKGLQKVSRILSERPLVATALTGGTFGMASGSASEILRQKQENESLDVGKVLGSGLKHAVMDGVAAIPGGIQADELASKKVAELGAKATKEIKRAGNQAVREVRWNYWEHIAKIKPNEIGLLIPEEITTSKDWLAGMKAVDTLNKAGYEAYFVGGCVRDILLGKTPKDYDIVTNAPAARVDELMPEGKTAGKNFAVKHTEIDGVHLEIATFRCDGAYSNGRQPDEVVALDRLPVRIAMREDAGRRDFKINSMFLDPKSRIAYYYFDGPADLMNKRIDTVGNPHDRFEEDPSRMLRVATFSSKLGFEPTEPVVIAMVKDAHKIHRSSGRAWGMEFAKLLMAPDPVKGLNLLKDTGLMKEMIPELVRLDSKAGDQDPIHHPEGNTWIHTMMVVDRLVYSAKRNMDLMFSGLFHDIGKPDTQKITSDGRITNYGHDSKGAEIAAEIARRLEMSGDQNHTISDTVAKHMTMHNGPKLSKKKLREYLDLKHIENLIELQDADALGRGTCCAPNEAQHESGNMGSQREFWEKSLEEARNPAEPTRAINAKPIINGEVLLSLGYKQGVPFGDIVREASFAQYQGEFTDIEGGLKWIRENCETPEVSNERTIRLVREMRERKAAERQQKKGK